MIYFIIACLLTIFLTISVKKLALHYKVVDTPDNGRHRHKKSIPLLGGVAIFLSFWLVVGYLVYFTNIIGKNFSSHQLEWVFIASLVLIIIGIIDDIKSLKPLPRIILPAIAVILVIIGGIGIDGITNPLGGILKLDIWQINFGNWGNFVIIADILVFGWLMGMIYTSKILDGLDGLTTGIIGIGSLMIFFLSSMSKFYQADTRLLALILAGTCLGFLILNFYPAKIFLGESGGLFLGFILGILAIIAGGKIATALLVMAVPILDLILVIFQRFKKGESIFQGDRKHLHFRLVDSGISQRKTVLFLYLIAFLFGITTLILPSIYKLIMLLLLLIGFIILEKRIKRPKCFNNYQ